MPGVQHMYTPLKIGRVSNLIPGNQDTILTIAGTTISVYLRLADYLDNFKRSPSLPLSSEVPFSPM